MNPQTTVAPPIFEKCPVRLSCCAMAYGVRRNEANGDCPGFRGDSVCESGAARKFDGHGRAPRPKCSTAPWRRAHRNNQTSDTVRVPQLASSRPRRVRPDQPRRTPSLRWTDQPTPHGLICEGAQRPVRTGMANDTLIAMPTLMRLGHLITVVTVARGTTRCSTSPGLRIRTCGCGARR